MKGIFMLNDTIFESFLERQFQDGMALAAASDRVRIEPMSPRPVSVYRVDFDCDGLCRTTSGAIEIWSRWALGIRFPTGYLRGPVSAAQVLMMLPPGHGREPFHCNLLGPWVCLKIRPGTGLTDLVHSVYELLAWQVYGMADGGLNRTASQWALQQPVSRFPIDPRPLKRRVK